MASIGNDVYDSALDKIATSTVLHITSAEATSFANVSSVTLGTASPTFTGPVDGDVSGRKITCDSISNGTVTGTNTATHYALVDGSTLLVTGSLTVPQSVTMGNTFTLTSFDVEFPDPA